MQRSSGSKEQVVVEEGEPGDAMFVVERGTCDVYVSDVGKVRSFGPADYFGEIALVSADNIRTATVKVASEEATFLRLARSDVEELLPLIRAAAANSAAGFDMKFAGEMEVELQDARDECMSASLPERQASGLADGCCLLALFAQCCGSGSRRCWRSGWMRIPRRRRAGRGKGRSRRMTTRQPTTCWTTCAWTR